MAVSDLTRPPSRLRFGLRFTTPNIAIDIGTARTRIWCTERGLVLDAPSVAALDRRDGAVRAVGVDASDMVGRSPEYMTVTHPIRHGVIADYDLAEQMLRLFLAHVRTHTSLTPPKIVVSASAGATGVEQRATRDALYAAGARGVYFIDAAMSAAIGADLPVTDAAGQMLVSIGAGTTEIAVISSAGVISAHTLRIGGGQITANVQTYLRDAHRLMAGDQATDQLIRAAGAAFPTRDPQSATIHGRDLTTGLPTSATIREPELRQAISPVVDQISQAIESVLHTCPPELAGDLSKRGLTLTGAGSLLRALPAKLRHAVGIPIRLAHEPDLAAITGAGRGAANLNAFRLVLTERG